MAQLVKLLLSDRSLFDHQSPNPMDWSKTDSSKLSSDLLMAHTYTAWRQGAQIIVFFLIYKNQNIHNWVSYLMFYMKQYKDVKIIQRWFRC